MNQKAQFNNILSECLDRILKGETVEQCLRDYPERAAELEPLLRTASAAKVASTVQPRPEFKARARYEFNSALRNMTDKKSERQHSFHLHWHWSSGWAIALVASIVILFGGGGTIAAASYSMPDSTLYPVKLATEEFQLALTSSDLDKTELNARFAYRRADEIVYLAAKGDIDQVTVTAERLTSNLQNMTNLADRDGEDGPVVVAPGTITQVPSPNDLAPISTFTGTDDPATTNEPTPLQSDRTSAVTNLETSEQVNTNRGGKALSPKLERLRKIISDNFEKRHQRLEEALKSASPDIKQALRMTIEKSKNEYSKALQNLYNSPQDRD